MMKGNVSGVDTDWKQDESRLKWKLRPSTWQDA